jgi:hypothetical protein
MSKTTSTAARPVTIVTATIDQLPRLTKPQRKFVTALLLTILALRGRVNFRNLARYGAYDERTYGRQFRRSFPWVEFHRRVLTRAIAPAHEVIVVQDASFVPKSGKKTYGLDRFWNGCASRAERGLEISTLAVVDVTQQAAYALAVAQTPPTPELTKAQSAATRVDVAAQQVVQQRAQLPPAVRHCVVDGWYAKLKYVDSVVDSGLEVITKLRCDANMRFRYSGPRTGKKGRPKQFDGKVNWQDLTRFAYLGTAADAAHLHLYTAELYHVTLKRWLRVLVVVNRAQADKPRYIVLATTDLKLKPADILRLYQARFQIEFLFRDAKQHTGLSDCQARSKAALDFHFNASLAAVNLTRAAAVAAHPTNAPFVFSLATEKQCAFNEQFLAEISAQYGYDLSEWKIHPAYERLRTYGAIAA